MPELLKINTAAFEFSVWANDISSRESTLSTTLGKRSHSVTSGCTTSEPPADTCILFYPPLAIELAASPAEVEATKTIPAPISVLRLDTPLFFENTLYQFEWLFLIPVTNAHLTHRNESINSSFRFIPSSKGMPARLTGTINTSNDVGWMRLPLAYEHDGKTVNCNISFEVLPTKMALHTDLPAMYRSIDESFPLWRFSLSEKTQQDAGKSKQRGNFPLMWLANFSHFRERFEQGLNIISQAPHSRLQANVSYYKADRLKGRLPYSLGAKLKEDLANGHNNKRYCVAQKRLSVDTPENRFIKMAVIKSKLALTQFERAIVESNKAPDKQRFSPAFLAELNRWQRPLQKMLGASFLSDVGLFSGHHYDSLALQQKTGYSSVYQVWQELKFYLDAFGRQSSISMKSVAEIYEVWCFLCIKNILHNELGFSLVDSKKAKLRLNQFFEYQLKDGFAGAFEFERDDGVKAKLIHEPKFTKAGTTVRSYIVNQIPDIVLEVALPSDTPENYAKRFIWVFDAKYRIKATAGQHDEANVETVDFAPDDAINQMHRYRDALIRLNPAKTNEKSRPVFGAFALYPGFFNQQTETNPYQQAINETGIGAFPLLPNTADYNDGEHWLTDFLKQQIGTGANNGEPYSLQKMAERWYVHDAARIPYQGMEQTLYPDLILTIALGGQKGREKSYFERFNAGTAKWYHLPVKTFADRFKVHVASEIKYLALATTATDDHSKKQIARLWPVLNTTVVARREITAAQAGIKSAASEPYYLFRLGEPLTLKSPVHNVPHRPISKSMELTTLRNLEGVTLFNKIKPVYEEAFA